MLGTDRILLSLLCVCYNEIVTHIPYWGTKLNCGRSFRKLCYLNIEKKIFEADNFIDKYSLFLFWNARRRTFRERYEIHDLIWWFPVGVCDRLARVSSNQTDWKRQFRPVSCSLAGPFPFETLTLSVCSFV